MTTPVPKIQIPLNLPNSRISPSQTPKLSQSMRFSFESPGSSMPRVSLLKANFKPPQLRPSFLLTPSLNQTESLGIQASDPLESADSALVRKRCLTKLKRVNLDELSQEQLLELAISILQKPQDQRTAMDIRMLERTTKNVEFFHRYEKETHEQICRVMTSLTCMAGQTVFQIGSVGETFYIILKGVVEVWVFLPKEVEEVSPEGTLIRRTELALTNVRLLQAGMSFGELALMEKKPRAATIICREKCYFGVLDKTSFDNILKEKEKRQLYEKIDFFASMKLFANWSYNAVKLLYYQTDMVECNINQYVIREGEDAFGLFLIKSGEFKVLAKILISFTQEEQESYALSRGVLTDSYRTYELSVLNVGEVIGEEELISNRPQQFSIVCASTKGSLFFLNKKEFLRRVWSDENSHAFLQNTIKYKKAWREARIKEIIALEKEKILRKPQGYSNVDPKKISTHLLYQRLSDLRMKQRPSQPKPNPLPPENTRISNKFDKEHDLYAGFELEDHRKLQIWKKFKEAKQKIYANDASYSLQNTKSKGYLRKLTQDCDVSMKLMRDIGAYANSPMQSNRSHTKTSKSRIWHRGESLETSGKADEHRSLVRIEPFGSVTAESQKSFFGLGKIYSEEQKVEADRRSFNGQPSEAGIGKPEGELFRKNESKIIGKFKKNIWNIFVTDSRCTSSKTNNLEKERNQESFDFFNVSPKAVFTKMN